VRPHARWLEQQDALMLELNLCGATAHAVAHQV
jgi:hypothetical protein